MLRTLAGIGIGLALVGSAHAQDQISVTLAGKSPGAVRAELYRSAKAVCSRQEAESLDTLQDPDCVEQTYITALQQFRTWQRTAYPVQTASRGH